MSNPKRVNEKQPNSKMQESKKTNCEKEDNKKSNPLLRRIFVSATLAIIGILLIGLVFALFGGIKEKDNYIIERLYYAVQIVLGLYVAAGTVVAVWQYCIAKKSEKIKNESDKVDKALELTKYYKDCIIPSFSFVKYVYTKIGAMDKINEIPKDKMKNFDSTELKHILENDNILFLRECTKSDKLTNAVLEGNFIYNLSVNGNPHWEEQDVENLDSTKKYGNLAHDIATTYMLNQMRELLNGLEYFAMYFTHNIADDTVVYQSLHQSYFIIVETMYYHISSFNTEPNNKYFVNLIRLYNQWKAIDKNNLIELKKREQEYNESLQSQNIGTVPSDLIF